MTKKIRFTAQWRLYYGGTLINAFHTSSPLMYHRKRLMWSQTPPKARPPPSQQALGLSLGRTLSEPISSK